MTTRKTGLTRREALSGAVAFGVGAGVDQALVRGTGRRRSWQRRAGHDAIVPFHGAHQAGIATAAQEYVCCAAFDATTGGAGELAELLGRWTEAAATLARGRTFDSAAQSPQKPPQDTGEALELGAARLTVTFGFGPSLFGVKGAERFGLASRRPALLRPLPPFQGESLDPARSGGDLCVQACADDPQVAFHAIHELSLVAQGGAALRWMQCGFGRTSSTTRNQTTPRNLMGFKDGTNNIRAEDTRAMNNFVWVQPGDGPVWLTGGTYLIARRIKMLFDVWDATTLEGQEEVFGRQKISGAPLGGRREDEPLRLEETREGELVIPANAHIRLASPHYNGGQQLLRRGYSFSEALEPGSAALEAGLFFIVFQRSPKQFIDIQRRLAASDALNRHTQHTASAIFACPPGARPGGFVGEGLFA